jgi:hypothetical protein
METTMPDDAWTRLLVIIACIPGVLVLFVALIYSLTKAARYGWLRGEELFIGKKLERNVNQEEIEDDPE